MAGMAPFVHGRNPDTKDKARSQAEIVRIKSELKLNPNDPTGRLQQQQNAVNGLLTTHNSAHLPGKRERGLSEDVEEDRFGTEAGSVDESTFEDGIPFKEDRRAQTISSQESGEAGFQPDSDDHSHPGLRVPDHDSAANGWPSQGIPVRNHEEYLRNDAPRSYPSTTSDTFEAGALEYAGMMKSVPEILDDCGFRFLPRPPQPHHTTQQGPQLETASTKALPQTRKTVRGQGSEGIALAAQPSTGHIAPTSIPPANKQPPSMQPVAEKPSAMVATNMQSLNAHASGAAPPPYYAGPSGTDSGASDAFTFNQTRGVVDTQDTPDVVAQGNESQTRTWRAESGNIQTNYQQQPQVSEGFNEATARQVRVETVTTLLSEQQRKQSSLAGNLDYGPDKLMKLDYSTLRSQPFDFSPSEKRTVFSRESLDELMSRHLNSAREDQNKLFETMTIDEWEDAGDWLLGRATDVLRRMKNARREKRKLTLEIEMEIEKRHDAVVNKRKATDEALDAMKKSGGQVLASTPRKRTTRANA